MSVVGTEIRSEFRYARIGVLEPLGFPKNSCFEKILLSRGLALAITTAISLRSVLVTGEPREHERFGTH